MDNITHTLVGLMIAEAVIRLRPDTPERENEFRVAAGVVSMLSNNVPDFDALYTWITPKPLGSLLHHRGHTHTLVLALPLGLFSLAPVRWWARRRNWGLTRTDWRWLIGLALAGGLTHIAFDALNSYGVHPFWPFFDGWFYGDSIFIIEPFLWAALAPPLFFAVRTRAARIALGVILLFGIALCFLRDFVPLSMAISVSAVALSVGLLAFRVSPLPRAVFGVGATLVVIATFVTFQRTARAEVLARAAEDFPKATTHDLVLTPMPANPLCWNAILIQTEGEAYRARSGVFAAFPRFLDAFDCPFNSVISPTAPSRFVEAPARPELRWLRQFSAPRRELVALNQECVAAALLRFVRAPYWMTEPGGSRIVGDVRYDRVPDLDFADLRIPRDAPCPRFVPPWIPPRADLLSAP